MTKNDIVKGRFLKYGKDNLGQGLKTGHFNRNEYVPLVRAEVESSSKKRPKAQL